MKKYVNVTLHIIIVAAVFHAEINTNILTIACLFLFSFSVKENNLGWDY